MRRIVSREAQHARRGSRDRSSTTTIRTAREEAARRLGRELDLAVERFAREAEAVLAERVEAELRVVEARLAEISRRLDSLSTRS